VAVLLSSAEACDRLGVRPQTLYAYVSRGLLSPTKQGRRSLFPSAQIDALAGRTARGRRPGRLDLNIETAITLLDPRGRLLYRGLDVSELAGSWSYERTAEWLWSGVDRGEPSSPWAPSSETLAIARRVQGELPVHTGVFARLRTAVAIISAMRWSADGVAEQRQRSLIATAVEALPVADAKARIGTPIAARLWPRLTRRPPTPARRRALDTALVVLADHELATSTLAARVTASTHADPEDVVVGALATLAGPLHAGAQTATRVLIRKARRDGASAAVDSALRRFGVVPGTGHVVYTKADPRAALMLDAVRRSARGAAVREVDALVGELERRRIRPVNADLALAALCEVHDMVEGAGETIVAVARMAGWFAHAAEEGQHELRFRPRAVYIGARP
jgi:citrate synthase